MLLERVLSATTKLFKLLAKIGKDQTTRFGTGAAGGVDMGLSALPGAFRILAETCSEDLSETVHTLLPLMQRKDLGRSKVCESEIWA